MTDEATQNPLDQLLGEIALAQKSIRERCNTPENTMRHLPRQLAGTVLPLIEQIVHFLGDLGGAYNAHIEQHAAMEALGEADAMVANLADTLEALQSQEELLREKVTLLASEDDQAQRALRRDEVLAMLAGFHDAIAALQDELEPEEDAEPPEEEAPEGTDGQAG